MSSDLELVFTDIQSIYWQPDKENDLRQHYRELDAPLGRNLIGMGRLISGIPESDTDWDWSKTWQENKDNGALPEPADLFFTRLSEAFLFPITLCLLYCIGKVAHNRLTGWLIVIFFASNALILLHTRRAMAESPLIFFEVLAVFTLLKSSSRPWLSAFPLALAINSKQSTLALILAGLFVIGWIFYTRRKSIIFLSKNYLLFCLTLAAIHYLLNPFLWRDPAQGIMVSFQARQELVQQQVSALNAVAPDQVLDTLPKRAVSMVYHLFYAKPAVADIGNYLSETAASETEYFSSPFTNLFRDPISASALLVFSIAGFIIGFLKVLLKRGEQIFPLVTLIFCTLLLVCGILFIIPLPFQRYIVPLVPFTCLWTAFAISNIASTLIKRKGAGSAAPEKISQPGS